MELGKLFGIRLVLNLLFLLILLFLWVSGFTLHVAILMWAILTHEAAHIVTSKAFGVTLESVELTPFGGLARVPAVANDPRVETCVALAGPFNNFFLIALGLLLDKVGLLNPAVLTVFLDLNLGIALFNLIPVLPLDGGRILRAMLSSKIGFTKATKCLASIGIVVAMVLPVAGIISLFFGFLFLPCFILPPFLFGGARAEARHSMLTSFRQGIARKRRLDVTGAASARAMIARDSALAVEVAKGFSAGLYNFVVVVNCDDEFRGIVTESELLTCLGKYGAGIRLGEILVKRKGSH